MRQKKVLKTSNDIRLSVSYAIPPNHHNATHAVIACHGFGGNQHSRKNILLQEQMLKYGITFVTFDFTAHGKSTGLRRLHSTLSQQVKDIYAVTDYLNTLGYTNFSLVGSSIGATTIFLSAAQKRLELHSLSLIAPRFDFPLWSFRHWPLFWLDHFKYQFRKAAGKVTAPTLLIKAQQDELVDNKLVDIVFRKIASQTKKSVTINTSHLFSSKSSRTKLITLCTDWIINNIK